MQYEKYEKTVCTEKGDELGDGITTKQIESFLSKQGKYRSHNITEKLGKK